MTVLTRAKWTAAEAAHHARVDAATAGHRARRQAGHAHPVEDFLFTYYSHSPAQLRRWHPGAGVRLLGCERDWKFYRDGAVDGDAFMQARGRTVNFIRRLLTATAARPAQLGCFGMHEWAMVYRLPAEQVRHTEWPLRLSPAQTDEVVEQHQLRCSHFDAFRFFTEPARPLNSVALARDSQVELEQPGCLHAGMDVYKWAYKLTPIVPSELVLDCFDLARDIRLLDMQAAPYDLRDLGVEPVLVETAAGKAEYVQRQRAFAERGNALRERLVEVIDRVTGDVIDRVTDERVSATPR